MKTTLFTVALASTASANIFARTAQQITDAISTISTDVQALTSSINAYKGDVASAVPVTQAESTLETSIKAGTSAAKGTSTLSDSDASSVLSAVNNLIPQILDSVNAFVKEKSAFTAAGLGQVADNDLQSLQSNTNDFADALISIAPSASQAAATSARDCINQAFSSAVAGSSASSCGGAATAAPSSSGAASSGASSASPTTTGGSGVLGGATTSSAASGTSATPTNAAVANGAGGLLGAVIAGAAVLAL